MPKKVGLTEPAKALAPKRPALPPEPSPSPRTAEARKAMTQEEVAALAEFVTQLTESSTGTDSNKEKRRLLFAIGDELKRLKPDSDQAAEVMSRMKGFQIELGQKSYLIEEYLTRGSFGAAFVVRGPDGEEDVLKLSLPFNRDNMFSRPNASIKDVMRAEKIRNTIMEAAALSRLSCYETGPGRPHDWIERKGAYPPIPLLRAAQFIPHPDNSDLRIQALVMEKIEGTRLDELVKVMDLAQDPNRLRGLAKELLRSLQFMHNRGVLHGDIKLSNIIVDHDLHPYVLDFGSAQVVTISGRQLLRPNERVVYGHVDNIFASTDYISGLESPSTQRDIYAMGVVLRKIIQGNHLRRKFDSVDARIKQLPAGDHVLVKMAEDMTKENPGQRPTVNELIDRLKG